MRASWASAARQEQPLLLAAGELRDLAPRMVGHAHQVHGGAGRLARGAGHRAHPAEGPVESHRHQVEGAHRVVPIDALALRDIGHLPPLLPIRLAVDGHRAGYARHQVQHPLQQGALAGAVGSDDAGDYPVRRRQIDVPQYRPPPVRDREVTHYQRAACRVGGGWQTTRRHRLRARASNAGPTPTVAGRRFGLCGTRGAARGCRGRRRRLPTHGASPTCVRRP